jgi:hypothetical protein
MNRFVKIATLAFAIAALAVAKPELAEAKKYRNGGHSGHHVSHFKRDGFGHHKGHKHFAGHKHHGHGGRYNDYYWWPFALPFAAAVTGALLSPFYYYNYNYYAPPAPAYYRRPCQPVTVQELNYYRQLVLVTRIVCYDEYGNAYIAR